MGGGGRARWRGCGGGGGWVGRRRGGGVVGGRGGRGGRGWRGGWGAGLRWWGGGGEAVGMEGERRQRESRRRREIVDLIDMAFLGLNLIGSRSILSLFRGGAALTYSGDGRWSAGNFAVKHGRGSTGGKGWVTET